MKQKIYFITFFTLMFIFCVNIKAYTIFENDIVKYDEEKIINIFKTLDGFNSEDYSNIVCMKSTNLNCLALVDSTKNTIYKTGTNYSSGRTQVAFSGNYCSFTINDFKNNYIMNGTQGCYNHNNASFFIFTNSSVNFMSYSNFNIPPYDLSINQKINVLDFSKYSVNLNFNDELFNNNSNFKKVCVKETDSFAITPTNGNYSDNNQYEDFIWFPYGLNNGLYKIQYDSASEYFDGNIIVNTKDSMYEHFYFDSYENITEFYNTDLPSELEKAGYIDKYSYYGYDAYKFFIVYRDGLFRFPIFTFDNPSKTHISTNGTTHGGGGLRLDGDEDIEISQDYCFYIKKDYEVNIVKINEWGDYSGTVISPDGDYDFSTSHNEFNSNTDSFLSQPIKFLNEMKDTISFINSLIYEFYISLPVLLRTFIITTLVILIVILIMRIGGYK